MNEWITSLLLRLLGVDLPPAGEGVRWHLGGAWNWSPPVVVLCSAFAFLATAYVLFFYFRERSAAGRGVRLLLAGLRLSLIYLVLLVMIFQLQVQFSRTSLPYLALAIDKSASMGIVDQYDDEHRAAAIHEGISQAELPITSRLNVAKSLLLGENGRLVRELARRYTLKTYTLAEKDNQQPADIKVLLEHLQDLEATGQASRLGAGVRSILNDLRGTQPAALVLFTDGITTDGVLLSQAASYARRRAVPLYIVGIGSDKKVRDVELSDLMVDDVVFVDDYVDLDFLVNAQGLAGETLQLVLKNKATGEVLSRKEIIVRQDSEISRQQLSHRPTEVGTFEYVIELTNLKDILKGKLVQLTREVEVRDDPIKVLLVQSGPSFEYRYLKVLLERDDTIDLHVVLQEADVEYAAADRNALRVFPVSRQKLMQYDVLILGDVKVDYFARSVMTNISDFVKQKGGGLLFISGPNFDASQLLGTPLAELLPVDLTTVEMPDPEAELLDEIAVRPTQVGQTSPHMQLGDTRAETDSIWKELPPIYWMLRINKIKQGARVLAEHPSRTGNSGQKLPVVILYYVPPGKVLWHSTDETYRWRYRIGDALFARYWVQAIRYLSRSKLVGSGTVELTPNRLEYRQGTPVQLRVRFIDDRVAPAADDGVTVIVEGRGQKRRQIRLHRSSASRAFFEGSISGLAAGNYRAWIVTPTLSSAARSANFKVVTPPGEAARREADTADMRAAALQSRGRYYDLENVEELLEQLPKGRPVKVASLPPIPLWNNWRILLLFGTLLVAEWLLRKRKGML